MTATHTVRSPRDLLAVIPPILGFTPTDSLVLCGIQSNHIVLTTRLEIMQPGPRLWAILEAVVTVVSRSEADSMVMVAYHTGPRTNAIPMVNLLADLFTAINVTVAAPIYVTGDTNTGDAFYSCLCGRDDHECSGAVPDPVEGRRSPFFGSREALAASLEAGPRAQAVGAILATLTLPVEADDAQATIQLLLDTPTDALPDADMARAAHVIRSNPHYRDRVLAAHPLTLASDADLFSGVLDRYRDDATRLDRFIGLVTCLPDADAGECLETLAAAAYFTGDATRAAIALTRASRTRTLGMLGQLTGHMLVEGIPPTVLLGQ